MSKPFVIPRAAKSKPTRTGEVVDIAARYFVYKLYEATDRQPMAWQVLRGLGEAPATIARAVERGWVIVKGSVKEQSGCLTDAGRSLARKALRY